MSMTYQKRLLGYIQKHRATGVMLDTNLLLLYIFGRFAPDMIGRSRLAVYDCDSTSLLLRYIEHFDRILTTHHVLAETSNLARQMLKGDKWRVMCDAVFPLFCVPEQSTLERVCVSTETIDPLLFARLGLTDAALAQYSDGGLLLTADLDLYVEVVSAGKDAINFNHMREAAGIV